VDQPPSLIGMVGDHAVQPGYDDATGFDDGLDLVPMPSKMAGASTPSRGAATG